MLKSALIPFVLMLQSAEPTPVARTVRNFYMAYSGLKISGLPRGAARKAQARCEKANPGDKPPWVEGDMFSGNFEGFTRFNVPDTGTARGERTGFLVEFEYAAGRGQKVTWKDELVLIEEHGRWVIDDVLYRRDAPFGNGFGSSLRQSLAGSGCS